MPDLFEGRLVHPIDFLERKIKEFGRNLLGEVHSGVSVFCRTRCDMETVRNSFLLGIETALGMQGAELKDWSE